MFYLLRSLDFEALEHALLGHLMQSSGDPFAVETVLVGSAGMKRALELAVTKRYGVASAIEFGYPGQWLWREVARMIPECPEESPFAPERLVWWILTELGETESWHAHPRLYHYLHEADEVLRYELALRIAKTFDHYLTYRPDWLERWGEGKGISALPEGQREDEAWQALLWQRVLSALVKAGVLGVAEHPARVFLDLLRVAKARGDTVLQGRSIHVFCVPGMPPLYLDWFKGLGEVMDVWFYVLAPTLNYWDDLVSENTLLKKVRAGTDEGYEVGHRLLASWGVTTQAYHRLLSGLENLIDAEVPHTEAEDNPPHLLARFQRSVNALEDMTPGCWAQAAVDDSLQIHACHSVMRSLEVLHDQLLTIFKADESLRPEDVLVLLPDLDGAIFAIETVFAQRTGACHIPYTITGAAPRTQSPVVEVFLKVLQLGRARCTRQEILDVLSLEIIKLRFDLDDDDVLVLEKGLALTDTRWGLGADHRESLGLPPTHRHSFNAGLERLILGYAFAHDPALTFEGQLPSFGLEGDRLIPFAQLSAFLALIHDIQKAMQEKKSATAWFEFLTSLVPRLTPEHGDWQSDAAALLMTLSEASRLMAGYSGGMGADVMMAFLEARLGTTPRGGVPSGAVTFTAISGLRQIPYRWIAILGLDDQVFPRLYRPLEFDLTRDLPRPGDQREDHEDKAIFLDALMSAKDGVLLFYSGFNPKDNSVRSPSIVLDELIDALVPALAPVGADRETLDAVRQALIQVHPMQPFHPDEFKAGAARTYRAEWLQGVIRLHSQMEPAPTRFVNDSDRFSSPPEREITLTQSIRFFRCPAEAFLKTTLGLDYPRRIAEFEEDDDLIPHRFAEARLAERLLPLLIEGVGSETLDNLILSGDEFPEGVWGEGARTRMRRKLLAWSERVAAQWAGHRPETVAKRWEIPLHGDTWVFSGEVGDCWVDQRIVACWESPRSRDWIGLWLQHLFCNAARGELETQIVIAEADTVSFSGLPQDEAHRLLADLLELTVEGLTRPLHFFPKSAWAYLEESSPDAGLKKARGVWFGSEYTESAPESEQLVYRLAFRGHDDPLDEEFIRLSERILRPMHEALKVKR